MDQQFLEVAGMLAEIESIKIYVEGMKVSNSERDMQSESAAYDEQSFANLAVRVGEISSELKTLVWNKSE
jgi:hypothetical protein